VTAQVFYFVAPIFAAAAVVAYLTYLLARINGLSQQLDEIALGWKALSEAMRGNTSGLQALHGKLDAIASMARAEVGAAAGTPGGLASVPPADQAALPEIVRRDMGRLTSAEGEASSALPESGKTMLLQQEVERLSGELSRAKDVIRRYRSAVGASTAERLELTAQNGEMEKRLSQLERERAAAQTKTEALERQIAEMESRIASGALADGERSSLEQKIAQLRGSREDLLQSIGAMQQDMGRMRLEKEFIEEQFVELSESERTTAVDGGELAVHSARQEIEALRQANQAVIDELAALKKTLERVQQEKNFIEEQFVALSSAPAADAR
jgi:DNA repair exonuclease SbcCD ATPase subunit